MSKPDARPGRKESAASSEGAREAFAQHFSQSFPVLWTIAAGIVGNRALAEDIVQEAALIGLGKFEQFQPGTHFTAWMGQMVRNVALNAARKERRQRAGAKAVADREGRIDGEAGAIPRRSAADDGSSELTMIAQGKLSETQRLFDDRMMQALGEVGEAARACLLLRTLQGMDYAEISRLLGIPQGTAMSHVHRAREFLRGRLGGMKPSATENEATARTAGTTRKPV